jgi:hypothetical protein
LTGNIIETGTESYRLGTSSGDRDSVEEEHQATKEIPMNEDQLLHHPDLLSLSANFWSDRSRRRGNA